LIQDVHPTGILSIVSDTWDLWYVLTGILPRLKNLILDRDGKVVIRPDSGDPVAILTGEYIEDLTNDHYVKSFDDVEGVALEIITEIVRDETPHGVHGVNSYEKSFKYGDKYYKVKVEFEWDRYDKQYYFISGKNVVSFEEFTPTPAQLGVVEILWNLFGGTVNEKGFKQLNPKIGAIYGDSITLERADAILRRLKEKGFASDNVVFGIGSFTYQYNTRDTFMNAMKATHVIINGEEKNIIKDPVTDDGTKKSATGRVVVTYDVDGELVLVDGLTIKQQEIYAPIDLLEDVFVDGELLRDESLDDIRARILATV
jgi:nicotinamide phosphoribosyltransferase